MLKLKLKIKSDSKPKPKPKPSSNKVSAPNPFMAKVKELDKERLVDIWKIGFQRLKNKRLKGDDELIFKAVCSILTFRYKVDLPKVQK